jgi:spore germination cell wall hydrolase CwlJ-like protein
MVGYFRAAAMAAVVACAYPSSSWAIGIAIPPLEGAAVSTPPGATPTAPVPLARPAMTISAAPAAPAPGATTASPPPLSQLVEANRGSQELDAERECIATAVYFEARGEPIEGQLAVAQVVLNRAVSGKFPRSACEVVKQKAQFSFVRWGNVPAAKKASEAWSKAVAITQIAWNRLMQGLDPSVLWYHATSVAPSWGRRLTRVAQIGAHIFYR